MIQGVNHPLDFLLGVSFALFADPSIVLISGNSIDRTRRIHLCIQNLLPFLK